MKYDMAAHPTMYKGVQCRSWLEARWACFFDQSKHVLKWRYEPMHFQGWLPDFGLTYLNAYRERHYRLVEVKPYRTLQAFQSHVAWPLGGLTTMGDKRDGWPELRLFLGLDPTVAGTVENGSDKGGEFTSYALWCRHFGFKDAADVEAAWDRAGNVTQWKPPVVPAARGVA